MENKAQILGSGEYSLNKAYLGSYKDFVPNHYKLGYWLTGKGKEKYGKDIWNEGITKAAKNPFSMNPVSSVLKEKSGFNINKFYKQTVSELKNEWETEIEKANIKNYQQLSPEKEGYANYLYPHQYEGKLYALKQSLDNIPRIVCINETKQEKTIQEPGTLFEESFSAEKNLLIWSENQPDVRWTHSDKSVICIYDIKTGQKKRFPTENKVFAPKIAPNQEFFVAVEVDTQNNHFLSVFDLKTAKKLHSYQTADNHFFFTPCWNNKSSEVFFIGLTKDGKYLACWKPGEDKHIDITAASFANIKNPVYNNGTLYFIGAYSGIDNLYAIDVESKQKYKITSVKYGSAYPVVSEDGKEIIFSEYSADGYHLSKTGNNASSWEHLEKFEAGSYILADKLSEQVDSPIQMDKPDSIVYESKKYSKLGHLLNFHSWMPAYFETDDYEIRPGFSMFSQNKLGTAVLHAGYDYSTSERTGKFVAGFEYSGWFPVFSIDVDAGKRASEYYQIRQTLDQQGNVIRQDTITKRYKWNEQNISLDMNIPFNLTSGKYFRLLQPEIFYEYTHITHDESTPENFFSGSYQSLGGRLYFHNLKKRSHQDLQSDWGQIIDLNYRYSPAGDIDFGKLYSVQTYLYFPGFANNHGFRLYNGFQKKEIQNRNSFSDIIAMPRGFSKVHNTQLYSFKADYRLPLACPDWSIGKLSYIKRFKASLFYDYANADIPVFSEEEGTYLHSISHNFKSLGAEVTADMHVMRFFAPIEIGCRCSYRPDLKDTYFDLLLSIDFSGF